jgi:hypothetical protein
MQTLEALNKGEIPSAGYVVEAFNIAVVDRCLALYNSLMSRFRLPVHEEELLHGHERAVEEVTGLFQKERFGRSKENDESSRMLLLQVEKVCCPDFRATPALNPTHPEGPVVMTF